MSGPLKTGDEVSKAGEQPLKCSIEGHDLVIRIGINVLAHCAENCPEFYDGEKNQGPPYAKVTDKRQLAKDVICALEAEAEDGSSLISDVLDQAIVDAHGDGSLAFEYDD